MAGESWRTVLLAGLITGVAAAGAAAPDGYVEEVLDNGLRVSILADATLPLVATQVWYHVGTANERDGQRGLAHLFEHLMFGASEIAPAEAYAALHHKAGGYQNAFTSPDETVYVSQIAPALHPEVLRLEAARMSRLVLDQAALERERKVVLEELRLRTESNPIVRAAIAVQQRVLAGHPYAYPPEATMADVAVATLAGAADFYRAWYGPGNAHLVIVGPVEPDATMALVRASFGAVPAATVPEVELPPLLGWRLPRETVVVEEDIPPVEVAVEGYVLPPPDAEAYWAARILTQLLAHGAVDPLQQELVRRRGKAVEAGIEAMFFRRGGGLVLYSASLPYRRQETAFRLLEEARRDLGRLEWLTPESLEAARRALVRGQLEDRYYAARTADALGRAAWWHGEAEAAFDRVERLRAVTLEDVRRAYREYVAGAEPVRVYVRPERVPIAVRLFGWLYPVVAR